MVDSSQDIYASFGVSPNDYEYDPNSNTIKLKSNTFDERWNLPVQAPSDIVGNVSNVPTNITPSNLNIYGLPIQFQKPLIEVPDNRLVNDYQISPGVPALNKLFGTGNEERFQTWPERMARSGVSLPADVYEGREPIVDDAGQTAGKVIERTQDLAGMAGMSGIGIGAATDATLGVVPVGIAKKLKVKASEPSEILKSAVDNTPSAVIDPDGALRINVKRGQLEDQEMAESIRGGVFYLPAGDKNLRYYKGKVDNTDRPINNYGGSQIIEGETAYLNPLVVKGATGGKAPEMAYTQLFGKEDFKKLEKEARDIATSTIYNKNYNVQLELTQKFLEKYAPELTNHAEYILENSKKGNQLRYALQEAAIASAVRNAGHDGIIGYSVGRGQNSGKPFISEIFDVRENRYPSPSGDYSVHPQFLEDSKAATGIGAINNSGFYSNLERTIANAKVEKATPEQWTSYLKNQSGIKNEELEFAGLNSLPSGQITKQQLAEHVAENGVKLGEVWKGDNLKEQRAREIAANERENWDTIGGGGREHFYRDAFKEGLAPKYSSYQLPNGENYRELLLTMPEKKLSNSGFGEIQRKELSDLGRISFPNMTVEQRARFDELTSQLHAIRQQNENASYRSSHWDEPNVLAHVRMNDRDIPGVGKSLHIEEIQSDWHQAGRKQGYKFGEDEIRKTEKQIKVKDADNLIRDGLKQNGHDLDKIANENLYIYDHNGVGGYSLGKPAISSTIKDWLEFGKSGNGLVPNAPFKKSWDELALKRALTEAVQQGAKKELENYHSLINSDPDKVAHALVKSGKLREICD